MREVNDTKTNGVGGTPRYYIGYSEVSMDHNGDRKVERPFNAASVSDKSANVDWHIQPEKLDRNGVWYFNENKRHPDYRPMQIQQTEQGKSLPTHRLMFSELQKNGRYGQETEAATIWPRQDKSSLMDWKISPEVLGEGKYKIVENERQQHRTTEQEKPAQHNQQEQNTQNNQAQGSQQSRDAFDQIDTRKAQTQAQSQGLER